MQPALVLSLFVILGLSHAAPDIGQTPSLLQSGGDSLVASTKLKPLRRAIRATFIELGQQFLTQIEAKVISNCKANGYSDSGTTLQPLFDQMKPCIKNKKIFVTPVSEYLSNIDECSKDLVTATRSCLTESQQYYPQFMINRKKALVSLMYNNTDVLRAYLKPCIPNFNKQDVQRSYIQCITDVSIQHHLDLTIPSKAALCANIIPAQSCFTNMVRDNCERSPKLDKFTEGFVNVIKEVCSETDD